MGNVAWPATGSERHAINDRMDSTHKSAVQRLLSLLQRFQRPVAHPAQSDCAITRR